MEKQAWYYNGICDALYDMQFEPESEKSYWEFVSLFKDVFVTTSRTLFVVSDADTA